MRKAKSIIVDGFEIIKNGYIQLPKEIIPKELSFSENIVRNVKSFDGYCENVIINSEISKTLNEMMTKPIIKIPRFATLLEYINNFTQQRLEADFQSGNSKISDPDDFLRLMNSLKDFSIALEEQYQSVENYLMDLIISYYRLDGLLASEDSRQFLLALIGRNSALALAIIKTSVPDFSLEECIAEDIVERFK